jgi:sigma-B regulation protein RsbU (phosphoserine phosphatase)
LTKKVKTMTAFMNMELRQQVGMSPGMITPNRRHLSHVELAGAEASVRYIPMEGVSGDYYDFLPLHEERTGLAVGDASGKGIGAAFLTASLCANLRAQAQMESMTSGELMSCLNRFVHRDTPTHQFVTLNYGIWDAADDTFTYSNAGHPPALHYQAKTGCVRKLNVGGIVLGVLENMEYPTESVSLETGDALVLYTDGITEASNAGDEMFGIERLGEVVEAYGEESSEELAEAIMDAASQFAYQGWQDDVTLMALKRTAA